MSTHSYKSTTNFDKSLELSITETVQHRTTDCVYEGFRSEEEAASFAKWWVQMWGFGYSGSALADKLVVRTHRWNSCD